MVVHGTTTTIESTNTAIYDNQVELNANLTSTSSPLPILSGLTVNRGSGHPAQLVWNELVSAWQISIPSAEPTDTLATIAVSSGGGLQITANLDLKQYAIYTSVFPQVAIDSNLAIKNTTVAPSPLANYNTIYTTTPPATNARDSGVFVTNTTKQGAQLSTKNQALLYSLIFF
jgi:hypothetical protein